MALRIAFSLIVLAASTASAECVQWDLQRYASSAVQTVIVRDADGDGDADVIASGNQVDERPAFAWFANRGDGTFEAERPIVTRFGERIEEVADFNRDGLPDLLASNYWSNGITIYLGRGALAFDGGAPYGTATHGGPSFVRDREVFSLSFGSGNPVRLHVFPVNDDGTLGPKTTYETDLAVGASPSFRTINGALEILVSERSGHLGLLRYDGSSVSVSRIDATPGFDLMSAFADLNRDGIEDIVYTTDDEAGPGEPVFVRLGNADGTFGASRQLASPRKTFFTTELATADFDGDGFRDLVADDFRMPNLYWFRGDGRGDFAEGVAIDAGGAVNAIAVGDVNGDGRADIVTVNNDGTMSVLTTRVSCGPRRRAVRP